MTEPPPLEHGWRVRILDLSGGAEDNIVEDVPGFLSLEHANLFARRYVRDSIERCRTPGMAAKAVLDTWFAYGEDAEVLGAAEGAWRSANELHEFAARRAARADRDWRSIDPRIVRDDEDDEVGDNGEVGDEIGHA